MKLIFLYVQETEYLIIKEVEMSNKVVLVNRKEECSGCTACEEACPQKCISMIPDEEGFLYPHINDDECIKCRKCINICPIKTRQEVNQTKSLKTVIVQTKDDKLLNICSSGGAFSSIAKLFIQEGGYVSGTIFDSDFNVKHIVTNKETDIERIAGSKYVQSDLTDTFYKIKELLKKGERVLFCGTPCQVAGLNRIVGKEPRLFLIDLVCHGVPSPKIWRDYIDIAQKKRGRLKYINFRSKKLGYHVSVMEETNIRGKKYYASPRTHFMTKVFFNNIADRPCCYECAFKTINRSSDLTIYDGWHVSELSNELLDNNMGFTNIIIQSDKGEVLFEKCKESFVFSNTCIDKAISLDGKMALKSVTKPQERNLFFKYYNKQGLEKAIQFFLPINNIDIIVEKLKILLNRTGMLKCIKSIKIHIMKNR